MHCMAKARREDLPCAEAAACVWLADGCQRQQQRRADRRSPSRHRIEPRGGLIADAGPRKRDVVADRDVMTNQTSERNAVGCRSVEQRCQTALALAWRQ